MEDQEIQKEDFAVLLAAMPDNRGVFLEKFDDKIRIGLIRADDLTKLSQDATLYHVMGLWNRPWVGYFANYLEYEHFPPETPLNAEFQFRVFKWHGTLWSIISIPLEKRNLAEEAAKAAKLKLADGIPIFMGKEPILVFAAVRPNQLTQELKEVAEIFPVSSDTAYVLENKNGDVVYEPGGSQDEKIAEDFAVKQLWDKHECPPEDDDPWR